MIISQKVKKAMQSELQDLTVFRVTESIRLTPRGFDRNDDFPEKGPTRGQSITIGEREHIGRPVTIQIAVIEVANPFVTGDQ
jgi:hypothetical protein